MKEFKVIFDSATLRDLTAIAAFRMERLGISQEEAQAYLRLLQNTIHEKLKTAPMRWPISQQGSLYKRSIRICFGKNLSPYHALFKVFEKTRQVLVYHIVWERSDYANLFAMDGEG